MDGSTDALRPSQPTNLRASGRANADEKVWVELLWRRSSDETITGYQYQLKAGDGEWGEWTDMTPGAMSSYRIEGLTHRAAYTAKIRATDGVGAGEESAEVAATWTTRPFEVKGLRATSGDGQATVTWNDPQDPSITKYQYQSRRSLYRTGTDSDGYPTWGYDFYGPGPTSR